MGNDGRRAVEGPPRRPYGERRGADGVAHRLARLRLTRWLTGRDERETRDPEAEVARRAFHQAFSMRTAHFL